MNSDTPTLQLATNVSAVADFVAKYIGKQKVKTPDGKPHRPLQLWLLAKPKGQSNMDKHKEWLALIKDDRAAFLLEARAR